MGCKKRKREVKERKSKEKFIKSEVSRGGQGGGLERRKRKVKERKE